MKMAPLRKKEKDQTRGSGRKRQIKDVQLVLTRASERKLMFLAFIACLCHTPPFHSRDEDGAASDIFNIFM